MVHRRISILVAFICLVAVLALPQPSSSNEGGKGPYVSALVTLETDETNDTVDFGFLPLKGTIGDFVWNDTSNRDGIQDKGEGGLHGVNVSLYNAETNCIINSTKSNETGYYMFEAPFGSYIVKIEENVYGDGYIKLPEYTGYVWYPSQVRMDDENGSKDHNGTLVILNEDNRKNMTIDFGYIGCN